MIDTHLVGMGWVTIKPKKFVVWDEKEKISHCQLEIDVMDYNDMESLIGT